MLSSVSTNAYQEAVTRPEVCDPDAPPLDPKEVRLFYDPKGFLRATVGNRTYLDVTIVRAFPLSSEDPYVGLLSGRLSEIGIIADPTGLDGESQAVIKTELERRYFTVRMRRVNSISEEFGATYWGVETDRGQRSFVAKGLRDNVTYLSRSRILIHDVDGNRYEIPSLAELDPASRSMILRVI
jgi:hypothetical protein